MEKKDLLTNDNISMATEKKLMKTYVRSVLLYGCEGWRMSKSISSILQVREMWECRRMIKISRAKMKNQEILKLVGEREP